MRPHDLEALEYPTVLSHLATFAQSPAGARACAALRPQADPVAVKYELDRAWEVHRLGETLGSLPSTEFPDLREHLKTLTHEGFILDGLALVAARRVLSTGRELGRFLRQHRDRVPSLGSVVDQLRPLGDLEEALERALDDDGTVRDDASDELSALRASLRKIRGRLTARLEALVSRGAMADVVAEQYVTLRNNRFVIPVKAHYGQKLEGIVQDRSASGETIFLEPLFAVELNNALLMTAREEERVIRRILADLTALLRSRRGEVEATFGALIEVDTLAAKARFAQRYRCSQPVLTDGAIDLRNARHPGLLLGSRPVTAIDVQMPADKTALVLTGPNTGGKTVALKTLGLLSLMTQTGLLIPVDEGSRMPCWRGIYADVGDEQNIQRNLSTFSAHVANLVEIERLLQPPALILLDEPGVGTDPEEGAALAIGLLQALVRRGARIVASTHYTPVKLYALTRETCIAAAVDFDRETLAPLYRLVYHSLGESLALLIAQQLGLSAAVLEEARGAQTEQAKTLNAALGRLEDSRRRYEDQLEAVSARERALATRESDVGSLLENLAQSRRQRWSSELQAASEFLRALKQEGRSILADLEQRKVGRRDFERFVNAAVSRIEHHATETEIDGGDTAASAPLQPGDNVELAKGGFRGELVSLSGERAWIRRGTMRIEVPAAQLRRAAGRPASTPPSSEVYMGEAAAPPAEVTLIGLRAKEALAKLETYLDRAAVAGHASVRIIHGIGSGALRRAVQEYLGVSPYCSTFRDAESTEGGAGVTIAQLGQ